MPEPHQSVIKLIDGFLKSAEADLEKEAAANLDLASDAKSQHASASVPDGTRPATEGARSSENEADVRKDVPDTINDEASKNTGGTEGATPNGDQGTVTMSADSGLKGDVDTPKKDHSKSMSDKGPGDDTFDGSWDKASAAAELATEANSLLADIATLAGTKVAATGTPTPPAAAAAAPAAGEAPKPDATKAASDESTQLFKQAAEQYPEDVEAGYVAAAMLAQSLGLMKDAGAEDPTAEMVATIQKEASADGMNYVQYLKGFAETLEKGAMPMGADPAALAALAGEGDAGGEMGAEEMAMGGEEAALGAGAEEAGAGEMIEGEGEAGAAEGGENPLEIIAAALKEAGISPEELVQLIAAQTPEGGAAGGEEEAGMVAPVGGEAEAGMAAPEVE